MKVVNIEDYFKIGYVVSKIMCVKCGKRCIDVRPKETKLEQLECTCGHKGFMIETREGIK